MTVRPPGGAGSGRNPRTVARNSPSSNCRVDAGNR